MSVRSFSHEESAWLHGRLYLYHALKNPNKPKKKATADHSSHVGHWSN